MVARRKWTKDRLQEALILAVDTSVETAALKLGVAAQTLSNVFHRHNLSLRDIRRAVNDNEPREISLGQGPFPIKPWPIPLTAWCSAARELETQRGCRWITGDPLGEHSYCCEPVIMGKKLCKKHRKKMFGK